MRRAEIESKTIEFVRKKGILDSPMLNELKSIKHLSREIREKIIEELSNELAEYGFDDSDEPSSYGIELEEMIDFCNFDVSEVKG